MMEEMCYIVATKNSGSLKGEHGTGRNMAPFVEMEWGTKVGVQASGWRHACACLPACLVSCCPCVCHCLPDAPLAPLPPRTPTAQAYDLMWELKHLFDPTMTINPGVVLNRDPDLHMKNLKTSPAASQIVDRCVCARALCTSCACLSCAMSPIRVATAR